MTPVPELTAALPDRYGRYGLSTWNAGVYPADTSRLPGRTHIKIGSLTVANGEMIMWQRHARNTRIWFGIGSTLRFHWDWDLTNDKPNWTIWSQGENSFTCTTDVGNVWSEILRMRTWSLLAYGWIALGSCPQDQRPETRGICWISPWWPSTNGAPKTIVKVAGKKLQYRLTMVN